MGPTPVTTSPAKPRFDTQVPRAGHNLTVHTPLDTQTVGDGYNLTSHPSLDTQKRCAGYNLISPANAQPITTEHTPVRTSCVDKKSAQSVSLLF